MGLNSDNLLGQTPLNEDESEGLLIRSVTTQAELNEFEQMNIEKAIEWTLGRNINAETFCSESFVKQVHLKMFQQVWKWAGKFRLSEKNIGIHSNLISTELRILNDDCYYWIKHNVFSDEEIAIRYKHRLVSIHCFSNGNGRHSRLMADVMMTHVFKKKEFTWGSVALANTSNYRTMYLDALHAADNGNIEPLIVFAKN